MLLLNTGGPVELTDILEQAKNIRAVLNISQPGQAGGYAVADILFGKAVPSGKLTATWARHYGEYPSADTYGYRNGPAPARMTSRNPTAMRREGVRCIFFK